MEKTKMYKPGEGGLLDTSVNFQLKTKPRYRIVWNPVFHNPDFWEVGTKNVCFLHHDVCVPYHSNVYEQIRERLI
jgi:hypothetical protein